MSVSAGFPTIVSTRSLREIWTSRTPTIGRAEGRDHPSICVLWDMNLIQWRRSLSAWQKRSIVRTFGFLGKLGGRFFGRMTRWP